MGSKHEVNSPAMLKKQLLFVAALMVLGQCAFLFASSQMTPVGSFDRSALEVARLIAPLFAITMIALGTTLYRRKIAAVALQSTLEEKIVKYRIAFITRAACVHVGGFVSVIAYFLTREDFFLAIAMAMFAVQVMFGLQGANEAQINSTLELDPNQVSRAQ